MATVLSQLKESALSLPERERIELAGDLLKSVTGENAEEVEKAWDTEISRRIEEIDAGAVQGIPASQVFQKLNEKHGWSR